MAACYISYGELCQELISLLLSAGASPNVRNEFGRTPLGAHVRFACPPHVEVVQSLLRAGASLDRCLYHLPIEAVLEDRETNLPESCNGEEWIAVKALIAGVRRAGSFKRYLREPHREVLMLRGLAMRGHLAPKGTRRTRGTAEADGGRRLPRAPRRQRRRLERARSGAMLARGELRLCSVVTIVTIRER